MEAGLVCFQKPFRLSDLAAAVSRLLAEKGGVSGISATGLAYPVSGTIQLLKAAPRFPDELLKCGDRPRVGRHTQHCAVALQLFQQLLTVVHNR